MKLKMVVTFDPFEISAPELQGAIVALAAGKTVEITTHPARESAKPKKAAKVEQVRS